MRKSRVNLPNRCYHLISRVAHRAFFLDDGERTRLVDLVRRGKCYAAGLETPGYVPQVVEKGNNILALRLLQLLQWEPRSPAYLRTTLGIASREYFTKAYLRPLTEAGLIARTDPDHPNSPRQKYALTKAGSELSVSDALNSQSPWLELRIRKDILCVDL